jgi:hypothetical protein
MHPRLLPLIPGRPANGSATQALIILKFAAYRGSDSCPPSNDAKAPPSKDAKAMAKSLRAALAERNVALSHGECLEIVSEDPASASVITLADVRPEARVDVDCRSLRSSRCWSYGTSASASSTSMLSPGNWSQPPLLRGERSGSAAGNCTRTGVWRRARGTAWHPVFRQLQSTASTRKRRRRR